ncbi:MAG: hypothetical protein DRQ48_01835 [Gammaproteobacteria bacterium]|nr:MAG: hypothetical protein DRQ48_01835 [Gammaproteobacteria bacterium]
MPKAIAWSWTRLDTFEQCPRKFQGSYISKEFPKPDFDADHFRKGRAVHKVLEDYLAHGVALPYPIKSGDDEWHIDLKFLLPLLNTMHEAPLKLIEHKVCLSENLELQSWYSKNAWCRVIFDALIISGDFALVVDWKTGKVKKYSDQLKLFATAVLELYPEVNKVLTAYVWCEHPNDKPVWAEYTRDKLEHLWNEFGDRAELIQMTNESGNWMAKKNIFCKWCDALPNQCEFKE